MSQKVHPKGFRLRSTGNHLNASRFKVPNWKAKPSDRIPSVSNSNSSIQVSSENLQNEVLQNTINGTHQCETWDSVWFSEPKKGKHLYTRILHEDQLIQDYTKGFFRSFGFYQQKCVIERKCNKELHITSYVLRTPKLQPSKLDLLGTRTRQEKVLQEGLQQGWIPFLIKSIISKILYDKNQNVKGGIDSYFNKATKFSPKGDRGQSPQSEGFAFQLFNHKSKLMPSMVHSSSEKTPNILSLNGLSSPSILPILTPQENSLTQVSTNQKRFYDLWNSWLFSNIKGLNVSLSNAIRSDDSKGSLTKSHLNGWWTHRSWSSTIFFNQNSPFGGIGGFAPNFANAMSHTYPEQHSHFNLTYSIRPAKSLISSSQLIVDYIADKIEQSVPIQQIFNELLRFFETEALCLGPAFIVQTKSSSGENPHSEAKFSESVAMVPKIEISSESGTKSDQYEVFQNSSNLSENWKASPSGRIPEVSNSQRPKVLGFRIICSGRLQISSFSKPAEKAESIEITRGVLPLNSFKANIDFAQTHATNAYGTCGIKVWVNRG